MLIVKRKARREAREMPETTEWPWQRVVRKAFARILLHEARLTSQSLPATSRVFNRGSRHGIRDGTLNEGHLLVEFHATKLYIGDFLLHLDAFINRIELNPQVIKCI